MVTRTDDHPATPPPIPATAGDSAPAVRRAAHELNNVVMVLSGQVELALKAGATGPVRDHLLTIREAAREAAEISRTLSAAARGPAGAAGGPAADRRGVR
jgi:hypothetical protein